MREEVGVLGQLVECGLEILLHRLLDASCSCDARVRLIDGVAASRDLLIGELAELERGHVSGQKVFDLLSLLVAEGDVGHTRI